MKSWTPEYGRRKPKPVLDDSSFNTTAHSLVSCES